MRRPICIDHGYAIPQLRSFGELRSPQDDGSKVSSKSGRVKRDECNSNRAGAGMAAARDGRGGTTVAFGFFLIKMSVGLGQ